MSKVTVKAPRQVLGLASRWRALSRAPLVTYSVIGACCVVFLLGPASGFNPSYGTGDALLLAQGAYFERWGVVPEELVQLGPHALLTPLTALFVHGNWLHLLGNMLFLYVFGAMTEEGMGRLHYAVFYVVTGYLALVVYAVVHASSTETLVGASGAISAVLGAFLCLFPHVRVTSVFPFLLFLPLRFPAWIVLIFWFVLQWLAAQGLGTGPGVAYLAHVVGFAGGFLYAWARFRRTARVRAAAAPPATEGESQP
ncbi:rhomboid family intramembrane serine protease [Streptomyces candidus]|uniref:Membrane associated rhomboid family serine protease n=1 Tax=Streptomyces candidus TaxID=67283 RepID=A0A7X0H9Z0_9ACTN|nr:rhomboid family intramembrane serine protease [Streptomyces candidus]MBB6433787.1 membrane associated rhomboid family serine protease [Streptomyces candidus]